MIILGNGDCGDIDDDVGVRVGATMIIGLCIQSGLI